MDEPTASEVNQREALLILETFYLVQRMAWINEFFYLVQLIARINELLLSKYNELRG